MFWNSAFIALVGTVLTLAISSLAGYGFEMFRSRFRERIFALMLLLLSIPFLILTLGLFYFVLNGILLWVAARFMPGYQVNGLVAGMLGALVIGIVNWAFGALFRARENEEAEA